MIGHAGMATANTRLVEVSSLPVPSVSANAAPDTATAPASVVVTLSGLAAPEASPTYAFPPASPPVWQTPPQDAISSLMASRYTAASLSGRFDGVGKSLLERFAADGGDFSQSVRLGGPFAAPGNGAQATTTLSIRTASGKSVVLDMTTEDGSLAVGVHGSAGLDEAERAAVGKLADAFQKALDGAVSTPPRIDLEGLGGFDTAVLSSVNFTVRSAEAGRTPTNLVFHADATTRNLTLTGERGTIDMAVDFHAAAILGNRAQRAEALAGYLRQFDAAAVRGQGDRAFMAMFKSAFGQLTASSDVSPSGLVPMAGAPSAVQASVLTGLPDFHASIVQAASAPNPLKPSEKDGFAYSVSQETRISGNGALDRGISQNLHSQLSASYHSPLSADGALMLTLDPKSQNYVYTHVEDVADSQTDIAYEKGRLARASIARSASQTTERSRYVMAKLVDQATVPHRASETRDLLDLLRPLDEDGSAPTRQKQAYRDQALAAVHATVGLEADPSALLDTRRARDFPS
ncbi:hypothetical protein [Luteibacter sp. SG786]|uniref:hypothetical protein n=1 Tax=Luteibacter sp. SG786 TaxID=2587130 RepID=UPI00141FF26C|nr:hypothetical protein [Luteibacter sp. SG786]NII54958.1 hypothetical protein [Luteibacter sp. SG786]